MRHVQDLFLLPTILCVLLLTGCATAVKTNILPLGDAYQAISTSSDEQTAIGDAITQATSRCQQQGKTLAVVRQTSTYRGVDKGLKEVANVASDIAFMTTRAYVPSGSSFTHDDDYLVKTTFKCIRRQ